MTKRNNKKIYKSTIVFIILDIIVIGCFIMMYGPWDKIRNMYVNTALKTMHHQYFANIFYSQETIDKINSSSYFVTINEDANIDDVIKIIHSCGTYTIKARNINLGKNRKAHYNYYIKEISVCEMKNLENEEFFERPISEWFIDAIIDNRVKIVILLN